jgi:hypothetical protein
LREAEQFGTASVAIRKLDVGNRNWNFTDAEKSKPFNSTTMSMIEIIRCNIKKTLPVTARNSAFTDNLHVVNFSFTIILIGREQCGSQLL